MNNELYHFGVRGMRWGVRRYRNKDGSLTPEGERRILSSKKNLRKAFKESFRAHMTSQGRSGDVYHGMRTTGKHYDEVEKQYRNARKTLDAYVSKQYKIIDSKYGDDYDKWERAERKILSDPWFKEESSRIANQYAREFNRAKLRDIGIKDLSAGEKAMKEYGLAYDIGTFNGVDTIRYGKHGYIT